MRNFDLELDLDLRRWQPYALSLAALFLVLAGVIGWRVTPTTADGQPRLLTWDDWQVYQVRQKVAAELGGLRREGQTLAGLLQDRPDPVRAGLALDRARQLTASGHPALASQRAALLAAAEAVNAWADGAEKKADAAAKLKAALAALNGAQP